MDAIALWTLNDIKNIRRRGLVKDIRGISLITSVFLRETPYTLSFSNKAIAYILGILSAYSVDS